MSSDEEEWMRRFRVGDREAFDAVYRRYAERVLGFAVRLSGSLTEAEDLAQEVFVAAYHTRSGFHGRSRLLTWLLGIAVRKWRDRCRSVARRPSVPFTEPEALEALGRTAPPEGLAEGVVRSLALAEALETLEPPFREALLLVHSQGLTYREAAEVTGEPVGTVKWRVSAATRRIRDLLASMEEEDHGVQPTQRRADRSLCGR